MGHGSLAVAGSGAGIDLMPQPVLTTERLTLRPFQADDVDPLFAILSDREAMRYWGPHETRSETERLVAGTMNASADVSCDFVIERDGRVVGKAGMWERPEIGFFVAPEHQRQGIATEALNAVIRYLFQTYDLGTLTADVDPRNTPSIMLLKNLGFVETGRAKATIQILGEWCDSVYLALHRA